MPKRPKTDKTTTSDSKSKRIEKVTTVRGINIKSIKQQVKDIEKQESLLWSGVIKIEPGCLTNLKTTKISIDHASFESEVIAYQSHLTQTGKIYFDPVAFNNIHKPLEVKNYKQTEAELYSKGQQASQIRKSIVEKALPFMLEEAGLTIDNIQYASKKPEKLYRYSMMS